MFMNNLYLYILLLSRSPVVLFVCSNSSSVTKNCCSSNGCDRRLRLRNFENIPKKHATKTHITNRKNNTKAKHEQLSIHGLVKSEETPDVVYIFIRCMIGSAFFLPRLYFSKWELS
jgi:hypothetical protein